MAIAAVSAMAAQAQTDATLNSVVETYTLRPDGAIDYDCSKSTTYHTHYAFNSLFGETFVLYNPAYQKLKVNECYTIQKDGRRINAPANAFNEVLPSGAAKSADYNNLREMVITHTGLEQGATSNLSYTITGTPQGAPTLDIDRVIPVAGADIKEYKVVVNVPQGIKLNWSVAGSTVKPVVNGNTYTWTFRNLAPYAGEGHAPVNFTGVPRLSVTTAGSLEEALRPLTIETLDICRAPAEVLKDKNTPAEKIEAVQKFIVNDIALGNVSPVLNGNAIRQCAAVMQSAYGTEAEKGAAMAKLLRAEGVDARVVVVFPKEVKAKSIAAVSKYLVYADGKFYGVKSTGVYDAALRADRDEIYDLSGELIKVEPAVVKIDLSAQLSLGQKEASIVSQSGSMEGASGAVKIADAGKVADRAGYVVYTLPAPDKGVDAWGITTVLSKREGSCYEIEYPLEEKCEYTIELKGLKALSPSKTTSFANAAGSVNLSIENRGDSVKVVRSIKLAKSVYTPSEYADLRKLLLEWQSNAFRTIVAK